MHCRHQHYLHTQLWDGGWRRLHPVMSRNGRQRCGDCPGILQYHQLNSGMLRLIAYVVLLTTVVKRNNKGVDWQFVSKYHGVRTLSRPQVKHCVSAFPCKRDNWKTQAQTGRLVVDYAAVSNNRCVSDQLGRFGRQRIHVRVTGDKTQ